MAAPIVAPPPPPPIWVQVRPEQPQSLAFVVLNRSGTVSEQAPAGSLVTKFMEGGLLGWASKTLAANKKAGSFMVVGNSHSRRQSHCRRRYSSRKRRVPLEHRARSQPPREWYWQ